MSVRGSIRAGLALIMAPALLSLIPALIAQEAPRSGAPRGPRVVSPEVSAERKITFRILAPKAQEVKLSGGDLPGLRQDAAMTRNAEGVWETTIGPIEPGAYRYHFNVDGVPVVDPRNPSASESNSNVWSLVLVPGSDFMDSREVPHGAVAEVTYFSSTLKRLRRMHVYTPPGYESGEERYPILYLLHGATDSDDSWSTVGRAGFILDNLIAAGRAKPMVVVMPAGHTGPFRFGRRSEGSRRPDEFVPDFLNDLLPHVEKSYRVLAGREHRAIAGLSMGGGQTLEIGFSRLDQFAYLGVFSSGVFGITGRRDGGKDGPPGPTWEERHRESLDSVELKKGLRLVWFATGKEDFLLETSRATVEMLRRHGFAVVYQETAGAHTWINWRNYLNEFAPRLFRSGEVTGEWRAEFDSRIGRQKYLFSLKQEGESVTGQASSEAGGRKREAPVLEGRIKDGEITFAEVFNFAGNDLRIEYQGKLSGEEIAFTRKVGNFATEEVVARRVPAGSDAPASASEPSRPQRARRTGGAPVTLGPQDTAAFAPAPPGFDSRREGIERGKVETVEYSSKTVGIQRKMLIYTPPGYSKDVRYPVLYLLHGIGDDETGWTRKGSAEVILDNLLAEKKALPMIVVMPNGRASADPAPANPFEGNPFEAYAAFEKELFQDILPYLESHYPVQADRAGRALAGLSMGGGQSLNFGLRHPEAFAWVAAFSPAPNTEPARTLTAGLPAAGEGLRLLWVSCGDQDGMMRIARGFHQDLSQGNIAHLWHVDSGGHTWPVWKNDLYLICCLLFRDRQDWPPGLKAAVKDGTGGAVEPAADQEKARG